MLIGYFVITRAIRQRIYDDAVAEFLAQEVRIVRPGLSDEALALHAVVPAPAPAKDGDAPENCSVCMETMTPGQPVRQLQPCRHCFHVECAETWLSRSTVCPMCRADLRTEAERAAATAALAQAAARFQERTGQQMRVNAAAAAAAAAPAAAAGGGQGTEAGAAAASGGPTGEQGASATPTTGVHAPSAAVPVPPPPRDAEIELIPLGVPQAPRVAGSRAQAPQGHNIVPAPPPYASPRSGASSARRGGDGAGGLSSSAASGTPQSSRRGGEGGVHPSVSCGAPQPSRRGGDDDSAVGPARPASRVITPTTISVLGTALDGEFGTRGDAGEPSERVAQRAVRHSNPLAPPPRYAGQVASPPNSSAAPLTRHVL